MSGYKDIQGKVGKWESERVSKWESEKKTSDITESLRLRSGHAFCSPAHFLTCSPAFFYTPAPLTTEVKVEREVQATEDLTKKKLFVDLDICGKCKECVIDCSYLYHPSNNGITYLREKATFDLICRHCEQGACVTACPQDALKRDKDEIPQRSSMLCIKCYSCVAACPFGTIYKEVIPFHTSQCDVCVGRTDDNEPVCVSSCPFGATKFGDFSEAPEENRYLVDENVLVHVTVWQKERKER